MPEVMTKHPDVVMKRLVAFAGGVLEQRRRGRS